ncbi:Nuclear cap-binding protein subunit 1, partial [Coemansia aciculifera]
MDFSGRLGGGHRGGGAARNVDEFGRERRDNKPHQRKPYDRPARGGHRGGGGGGGARAGMGHQAGPVDEAQEIEARLSSLIVNVGLKNTPTLQNNLEALSIVLEKDCVKHELTVMRTFRQCVLELPWKVTVYSTLAGLLNAKNSETGEKVVTLMHAVLRASLARGDWGSVKVLMRFFGLLVATNTITASSLLAMLDAFLAPLAEGAKVSASNNCYVFIVLSTLLWAGRSLKEHMPAELEQRLELISMYVQAQTTINQGNTLTTVFHDAPPKGTNTLVHLLQIVRMVAGS